MESLSLRIVASCVLSMGGSTSQRDHEQHSQLGHLSELATTFLPYRRKATMSNRQSSFFLLRTVFEGKSGLKHQEDCVPYY